MTVIDRLRTKVKVIKVENYLRLLYSQYQATSPQPDYANFPIVTVNSGPMRVNETLQTGLLDQMEYLFVDSYVHYIKEYRS